MVHIFPVLSLLLPFLFLICQWFPHLQFSAQQLPLIVSNYASFDFWFMHIDDLLYVCTVPLDAEKNESKNCKDIALNWAFRIMYWEANAAARQISQSENRNRPKRIEGKNTPELCRRIILSTLEFRWMLNWYERTHTHHAPLHFIAFDIDCHKLFGLVNFNWITCFVCFNLIEYKKSLDRIQGHRVFSRNKNKQFVCSAYVHILFTILGKRERERAKRGMH